MAPNYSWARFTVFVRSLCRNQIELRPLYVPELIVITTIIAVEIIAMPIRIREIRMSN